MTKMFQKFTRRIGPALAAGMLLQAGGCTIDPTSLASGLANAIASNLISSIVFGTFGVGP